MEIKNISTFVAIFKKYYMNKEINLQKNKDFNEFKKDYLKGTHIDIYGDFDTELHVGKYFIHLYNELCHTYSVYANINLEGFLKNITEVYKLSDANFILKDEQSKNKKVEKIDYTSSSYIIKLKEKILIELNSYRVVFWYGTSVTFSEITKVLKLIDNAQKKKKHNKKFYMVTANNRSEYGYEFRKFNIKKQEIDIESNYNDDFKPVHSTIFSFLKEDNKNGLILLHGKFGTGKTTYIRYMMSKINKRFIFLPINMMEAVSAPNFLPFISKYKNSVLVLEDCEDLLTPRGSGSTANNSLVNLLNLGDGLLSDALSFKIICTFNANIKQIDQAILRKGRLIARYEFKDLHVDKVAKIWEKLGYKGKPEKDMNLAELYNKDSHDFSELKFVKKVGF